MSRSVSCEIFSNVSLFNVVSKDVCSLLGYSSYLHLSERILRNIISVLRKSVNETWIGLLYFWNHCYWNWNKVQTKFVANTKYKKSLWQIQNTEIQVAKLDWEEHRTMCIEKCADILGKLLPHPCLKCPRFSYIFGWGDI